MMGRCVLIGAQAERRLYWLPYGPGLRMGYEEKYEIFEQDLASRKRIAMDTRMSAE